MLVGDFWTTPKDGAGCQGSQLCEFGVTFNQVWI